MRLLIIGTLDGHIAQAGKIALSRGARVAQVDDIDSGLHALRSGQGADMIMVDVHLDIGALIECLVAERINVPVVACGIGSDTRSAVAAIRAGAREYVPLPPDPELIAAVLEAVTEENNDIIFQDPAFAGVLQLADQVAASDASILVVGESGTGKELIARYLHRKSKRAARPFVSINCAAIPEHLLESELFGHEKGAFTGAVARRIGKFEEADGGTLLLDEITEMEPRLQAKLLRALQEREIDRLGGSKPVTIDIRVIATTNRDIQDEVRSGRFREDLMFRLNVVTLSLPPLRERRGDIMLLASHFMRKYAGVNGLPVDRIDDVARELLLAHPWRGNVRELENTMHRAVLLADGKEIGPGAIRLVTIGGAGAGSPAAAGQAPSNGDAGGDGTGEAAADMAGLVGRTVADVERDLIIETLDHCLGNRTHAANILGISIRTLRNKLRQYGDQGIRVPQPGEGERPVLTG